VDSLSIAHYIPAVRLADGGVVRAVLDWCRLLAHRGHRVTLLTYDATDIPQEWLAQGTALPQIVVLPRPNRLGRLDAVALNLAQSVIERVDVLHLHGLWLSSNLQLAAIANKLETPYLLTTHGMLDNWATSQRFVKKRIFHALIGRQFLEKAAQIHCMAEEELRQATPWLNGAPATILHCLVDLEPFQNLSKRTASTDRNAGESIPTLLFLGRLHVKKGIDLLIDVMAELRRRGQAARLLIAGQGEAGYEADLRDQTRRLGLDDVAQFLGLVTGDAKTSLFQSADLFVLPTSQENFGIALIEAAACGVPLLTTRGVDIWRELEAAGAAIAERSVTGFADAIERLLRDRAQLQKNAGAVRDWVFATLDPERLLPEYERLYQSVASRS
jgi:glycosyltransferase involved in cell wall biosynthesis